MKSKGPKVNVIKAEPYKDGGSIRYVFDDTTVVWEDHRMKTTTPGKFYLNSLGSHSSVKEEYREAIVYYKQYGNRQR